MAETPLAKAIAWIDAELQANPRADLAALADEAGRRFELTPLDGEFLFNHLAERARSAGKEG